MSDYYGNMHLWNHIWWRRVRRSNTHSSLMRGDHLLIMIEIIQSNKGVLPQNFHQTKLAHDHPVRSNMMYAVNRQSLIRRLPLMSNRWEVSTRIASSQLLSHLPRVLSRKSDLSLALPEAPSFLSRAPRSRISNFGRCSQEMGCSKHDDAHLHTHAARPSFVSAKNSVIKPNIEEVSRCSRLCDVLKWGEWRPCANCSKFSECETPRIT